MSSTDTCMCCDTDVHLLTAIVGYFAVYRAVEHEGAVLNNIVAWEIHECCQCHRTVTYALVLKAYTATLVRAQTIDGFVGISGPDAHAGQKAAANEMLEREKAVRAQEVIRRITVRRTVTSTE